MAGLVLKAVQWGVDKLPDSAFEALPGNYYKPKDRDERDKRRGSSRHDGRRDDSKRYSSDDEYDSHRRHRHHGDHRRRHHSRGADDRRSRSRRRGSYEDSEDDMPEPPSRRRSESHRRRRDSYAADDRYGYEGRSQRGHGYEDGNTRPPYPVSNVTSHEEHDFRPGGRTTAAAAAAGAGAAVAAAPRDHVERPLSPQSDSRSGGSIEQGYVPYSNVYGQPTHQSMSKSQYEESARAMPASRPVGLPPDVRNPSPEELSQNRSNYNPSMDEYDPRYGRSIRDDRYTEYDSRPASFYSRSPSRSPSRPRRGRAYSPSYTSFDSRYDDERPSESKASRSKSKSRVADNFDKSKRGLGYGAIGALTGALVGSEVGKGPLPAIVGAVIGGAGTNAFQAREKRKEGRRQDLYPRDRLYDRRDARVAKIDSNGYYSD